ncbi:MAG: FKBP-type peptidyl-prolyl cis-trans isomerase [Salinisphaera sp.]|nr:FKBP-type peptidyl-prolyl cis-trans isomerase [Salinisphaera sp.]
MTRFIVGLCAALLLAACNPSTEAAPSQPEASQASHQDVPKTGVDQPAPQQLETEQQKISYAIGVLQGRSLLQLPTELDAEYVTAGLRARLGDGEPLLSDDEASGVFQKFMAKAQKQRAQQTAKQAAANEAQAEKFLAENKTREGVEVTASGLQYKVLEPGDGPVPGPQDQVTVQYEGRLIDGTVFDSSYKRGKPATFQVDAVIPGWTEALQLMHEGAKYQLFIPPNLAYGTRRVSSAVGPNATLIFDVELVKVLDHKQQAAPAAGK